MSESDDTTARFTKEIEAKIDYFRQEYDITYATVIGVLMMIAWDLSQEANSDD